MANPAAIQAQTPAQMQIGIVKYHYKIMSKDKLIMLCKYKV